MTKKPLTYRRLAKGLKNLGYVEIPFEFEGNQHLAYKHKEVQAATILLPQLPLDDPVAPFHVNKVRAILLHHGLMEDNGLPF